MPRVELLQPPVLDLDSVKSPKLVALPVDAIVTKSTVFTLLGV
jgi:hypothetical protein